MSPTSTLLATTVCLLVLTGCGGGGGTDSAAPVDAGEVIATVNGNAVTAPQLDAFLEFRRQTLDQPEVRDAALKDLVDMLLLVDETRSSGLLTAEAQAALKVQEWSFLANLALSDMARSQPITDQEITAEYQRQLELTGGTEYKLKHMLVPSQLEGAQLISRLTQGEPFDTLLAELDPAAGSGGDLGWVNLVQVPEGFTPVLKNLKPGEFSPIPIGSEYGWHVVLLEDQRTFQPPALDQIEEGIRNSLSRQRLERHMQRLRSQARIDLQNGP
ncbi:MAG: peptidyl-prolyl cis-trans isomerase [Pseudomonadota bacterium]